MIDLSHCCEFEERLNIMAESEQKDKAAYRMKAGKQSKRGKGLGQDVGWLSEACFLQIDSTS